MNKELVLRFVISSAVTFVTAFGLAVLPMLGDVEYTKGAVFALILVGARAGVKAVSEGLFGLKG